MNEPDMVKRVFLLGILKRESGESLKDVTESLVNTGMFDLKEAKRVLAQLKEAKYIINDQLTIKGISVAKETEVEFTLK